MITLDDLRKLRSNLENTLNLDLNYSSMPTIEQVRAKPKYPYNTGTEVEVEAFEALETWWRLDAIIRELEVQFANLSFAHIAVKMPVKYSPNQTVEVKDE